MKKIFFAAIVGAGLFLPSFFSPALEASPDGTGAPTFLDADAAFPVEARVDAPLSLSVSWHVAPGHYLYRDSLVFRLKGDGMRLAAPRMPAGEVKDDKYFGKKEIYRQRLRVELPLTRQDRRPQRLELTVGFQGCAEAGICYPPQTKVFSLQLPPMAAAAAAAGASPLPPSEQDRLAGALAGDNRLYTLLVFFGLGLLLSLTPCVFPMIPILSGIIVGHGAALSSRRALALSLTYVFAMSLAYTMAGVVAALSGANLQAMAQNPWGIGVFAAIFVLLALSMFGFYELHLPRGLSNTLDRISRTRRGGSFFGVAVMGFLSAIVVSPCVAPPLTGALLYIGKSGDVFLGAAALFALSMGMGAPLLALGCSAGRLVPKAGPWLDTVKSFFGVLLLGVAIWLLDRIIPAQATMALWAVLFIVSSVVAGALDIGVRVRGWSRFWQGLGFVVLVYGILLLIGAAMGATDPFRPLAGLAAAGGLKTGGEASGLAFQPVGETTELDRRLAGARNAGRPVMLVFSAKWCASCKELEKGPFADPGVTMLLADFVLLRADVTANDAAARGLLRRFSLIGPPALLFFGTDGGERPVFRLVGPLGTAEFSSHLKRFLAAEGF